MTAAFRLQAATAAIALCVLVQSPAASANPYTKVRPSFVPSWEASPPYIVHAMLRLADVTPADFVCDLGSGDGRVVIAAAKDFGARALGVEFNPKTLAKAKENAK